jgi:hypothetical protein
MEGNKIVTLNLRDILCIFITVAIARNHVHYVNNVFNPLALHHGRQESSVDVMLGVIINGLTEVWIWHIFDI